MNCCDHCIGADEIFSRKTARRDLKRYRRKGPNKSTVLLLDHLRRLHNHDRENSLKGRTLLDVGGGIGAISFELFDHGLAGSVHVDASTGYLETSRSEAGERGLAGRINYLYGDFTELADSLKPADIVTLDRVVCCYPDMEKLIAVSAEKSTRYLGLVYPRERWTTRMVLKAGNLWFRIRRLEFRTYLHPPDKIARQLQKYGFRQVSRERTFVWESAVFERAKT